jgi:hypothetical protein
MKTKIQTTTDAIRAAEELMEEAKQVSNRDQHAKWWDKKVDVLQVINNAFETGYFTGEAYDELWQAKHIIGKAETVAGKNY